jgi:hypothetical protein
MKYLRDVKGCTRIDKLKNYVRTELCIFPSQMSSSYIAHFNDMKKNYILIVQLQYMDQQ